MFGRANPISYDRDPAARDITNAKETVPRSESNAVGLAVDPTVELARCFCVSPICLTSRSIASAAMEAILWRQVRQILLALDALDRRKPQERRRHSRVNDRAELPTSDDYG